MLISTAEEPRSVSYKFQDCNDTVLLILYANGAFEQKDFEFLTDTDSLEISGPTGDTWKFQLYAHVYADQTETKSEINESRTWTTLEVRLRKQQSHKTWPQLYSLQSTPIIPTRKKEQDIDMIDQQDNSTVEAEKPYELSTKKVTIQFTETNDNKAIARFEINQVHDCEIEFTETNFTAFFYTNDEHFLQLHSIPSTKPIKLFVRVQERIKPEQCSFRVTPTNIQVTLITDSETRVRWHQLEPNEYSDFRSSFQSSPLSITNTNPMMNTLNRTFPPPLPSIDRLSDKTSSMSSFHSKENTYTISTSSIGYTGIFNPANSCFMNAALQCLSNTCELRDYFLQSYHLTELNQTNPLGMKGIMAEEFASVIKSLWSGKSGYINANILRDLVAKRHQEFVGNGQHDAQELLTIILDAMHEDLNRVINKPQVPPVEDENRSDYIIADEYWRGYLSRNNSLVVQLFTGQFKSKTKCPQCHKESVTFDPFTSLSVPIPKRISVDTIVTYRNDDKAPMKYRSVMSADGTVGDLKRLLSPKCGLALSKMVAYKIQNNRSLEYLKDDEHVPTTSYSWSQFDNIYITEILSSAECNGENILQLTFFQRIFKLPDYISACAYCQAPPNPHHASKFCPNCYQVSYCDQQCEKFHAFEHKGSCEYRSSNNYENIGLPFIISLPESKLTCKNVFEQISIHAKRSVDIHLERSKCTRRSVGFNDDFQRDFNEYDEYGGSIDREKEEEEDRFSDIENVDWTTIKSTLSSADSWSICRIGDYFVQTDKNKRRHHPEKDRKEKLFKSSSMTNADPDDDAMIVNGDTASSSSSSTEGFDMLDDIYGSQPLFRVMPQTTTNIHNSNQSFQPIVEAGDDGDSILRHHTTFSIDWFTDNKFEAPLRVTASKHRSGINSLLEDDSVFNSLNGDQDVTLQQCLQLFIDPEVLGPDDKWYCPHCKEHIQAEKKMSVWRLPPILIIHLKRFKYNQYSSFGYLSSSREKIDTTVKFPIHDLNMAPYCSAITDENPEQNISSRYDLYGIVNHRGTSWFGHYTAYARLLANNDAAKTEIGWRNFDDEHVTPLRNVKDLVRSDAYVLFYRHRSLSVNFVLGESTQM